MSFKLEDLIAAPSQELLNLAKKIDLLDIASHFNLSSVKKVQVGKDQEKVQSEKDSQSENRGGKKPNQQSGADTKKTL